MKLSNLLVVGMKACLTGLLIHLLLIKANMTGERDFHNLVCYRLLMPFPVIEGETADFVKVITLLGLSFNSFILRFHFWRIWLKELRKSFVFMLEVSWYFLTSYGGRVRFSILKSGYFLSF